MNIIEKNITLCKLLKIKPVQYAKSDCGKISCTATSCTNCVLFDYYEVYVDFTQPANFMRLLELAVDIDSEFFFFLSSSKPAEYLIDSLISKFESSPKALIVYQEKAQNIEWRL